MTGLMKELLRAKTGGSDDVGDAGRKHVANDLTIHLPPLPDLKHQRADPARRSRMGCDGFYQRDRPGRNRSKSDICPVDGFFMPNDRWTDDKARWRSKIGQKI